MNVSVHRDSHETTLAAGEVLSQWLVAPGVHNVMLAAGNSPLELYQSIAARNLALSHLNIFALDEYVGVPLEEPRNCANLIRRTAVNPWRIPPAQYFTVSSLEAEALASVKAHEQRIREKGGLDVIILGLGQNGHLGFNEPGSAEDSVARVLDLDPSSIEANRKWFNGDYAPARGVTVGLSTILLAKRVLLIAYGPHKAAAAQAMLDNPRDSKCPASLLQGHPNVHVFLDEAAAAGRRL